MAKKERSLWPAEDRLIPQLRKQRAEKEARRHRDYVAPEAVQEEIDEMIQAAADAAGLTVPEYEAMVRKHGGQGHAAEIFDKLTSGEAGSVEEARRLLHKQAGDEAGRGIDELSRAIDEKIFDPRQPRTDWEKLTAEEYLHDNPPKKERRGRTKKELAERARKAIAKNAMNAEENPPPDFEWSPDDEA